MLEVHSFSQDIIVDSDFELKSSSFELTSKDKQNIDTMIAQLSRRSPLSQREKIFVDYEFARFLRQVGAYKMSNRVINLVDGATKPYLDGREQYKIQTFRAFVYFSAEQYDSAIYYYRLSNPL